MTSEARYVIGIDEAGRGPIAGPVTVGAVALSEQCDRSVFVKARDSKKLPMHKREELFALMREEREKGVLLYAVRSVGPSVIDKKGIVFAVRTALGEAIDALKLEPGACEVLLDGGLSAPEIYVQQTTIIRGDETELPITLAGIAAKVIRDHKMVDYSNKYPGYNFETHKGYGTKGHYDSIKTQGLCEIHRRSFLSSLGV